MTTATPKQSGVEDHDYLCLGEESDTTTVPAEVVRRLRDELCDICHNSGKHWAKNEASAGQLLRLELAKQKECFDLEVIYTAIRGVPANTIDYGEMAEFWSARVGDPSPTWPLVEWFLDGAISVWQSALREISKAQSRLREERSNECDLAESATH